MAIGGEELTGGGGAGVGAATITGGVGGATTGFGGSTGGVATATTVGGR